MNHISFMFFFQGERGDQGKKGEKGEPGLPVSWFLNNGSDFQINLYA